MRKEIAIGIGLLAILAVIPTTSIQIQAQVENATISQGGDAGLEQASNITTTGGPDIVLPQYNDQNLSETKEQAITLLNSAEQSISEARSLIASLEAALQAQAPEIPEQVEIITEANESADDVVEIVETVTANESAAVDDVSNATDAVVEIVEDSIEGNANASVDAVVNASDSVVEIVEEVIDPVDNASAEVQAQSALIRLLTQLVDAQNYNQNITAEEKADLQTTLQETIVEQAGSLVESLG